MRAYGVKYMKKRALRTVLAVFAATVVLAGIFLLLSCLREKSLAREVGAVMVEPIAASALPRETGDDDWFMGDWLGVYTFYPDVAGTFSDFGSALLRNEGNMTLLRVYRTADGYGASIGGSTWKVTAHDMESFSMVCTAQQRAVGFDAYPMEDPFFFENGATQATFTFRGDIKSADPSAHVPETNILYGEVTVPQIETKGVFLLSFVPPAGERDESSGIYPCWYGGYADMDGEFMGMALLGENSRNRRFFGQLLKTPDGHAAIAAVEDGYNMGGNRYGKRDMRMEDITWLTLADPATQAYWPTFRRYDPANPQFWGDSSQTHGPYYELTYIPQLQEEIRRLEAGSQNIWTQNGILVRKALLYCAKMAPGYSGIFDIQQVMQKKEFLPAVSLAGIYPGDTLEDAEKLYALRVIREEEAQQAGLYGVYDTMGITYYTDGNGLVLSIIPDGRIARVSVYQAGYETPDGRQAGAPYDSSRALLKGQDATIEFGYWGADIDAGVISRIDMNVTLDRVWSETLFDIDGDGEKERLTLSGRCAGNYLEQGTVHGDYEAGTVELDDYGTVPLLSIFKEETLVETVPLHMYTYYLLPFFPNGMQKKYGDLVISCPTGGSGGDAYYTLKKSGGDWRLTYLGIK